MPFATATASADRAFRGLMSSLIAVFAAIFVLVNAVLYLLLIRPMRGASEIASLIRSFNRMRKSLDKALRLLEP